MNAYTTVNPVDDNTGTKKTIPQIYLKAVLNIALKKFTTDLPITIMDLQVSRKALNGRHLETNHCKKGAERKQRRLAAAEVATTSEKAFHA